MVTEGKFTDALTAFQSILQAVPLLVVDSRKEVDDAKQIVGVCKEYVTGLLCEIKRKVGRVGGWAGPARAGVKTVNSMLMGAAGAARATAADTAVARLTSCLHVACCPQPPPRPCCHRSCGKRTRRAQLS
jgi:hypothetical protein